LGVDDSVEPKRATVHDVARTAGVSLATVDRVLNARPGVRPETAEKVENAIKALNFRRDLGASLLARARDLRVVFLIPDGSNAFMESLNAAIARRVLGTARIRQRRDELGGFNVVLLILFAIAIMDGVGAIAMHRPHELLLYVACALAVSLVQQALGTLAFLWHGRSEALTVGLVSGNRNMASVWASLGAFATPELTLFFIAVQVPIYLTPALLRPFYRRMLGKPGAAGEPGRRAAR